MRRVNRILFALHLFVGIGAMAGGLNAILNPKEPFGMPAEFLNNSPFSDYLIPGIILFTIIGVGNVISALIIPSKLRIQGYVSSIFSWALVIFIVVQCIMLNAVVFLHILFFTIGLIEAALSMINLFEKGLFPANLVMNFYKGKEKM